MRLRENTYYSIVTVHLIYVIHIPNLTKKISFKILLENFVRNLEKTG